MYSVITMHILYEYSIYTVPIYTLCEMYVVYKRIHYTVVLCANIINIINTIMNNNYIYMLFS